MKAISLLQPWASLVVRGIKKMETRSWSTKHRGALLIHASAGKAGALLALEPPFSTYIQFHQLPFRAIIGQVALTEIIKMEDLPLSGTAINQLTLEERAFGDYTRGRYVWIFDDPIQFDRPVPIGGALGLWEYNGAVPPVGH